MSSRAGDVHRLFVDPDCAWQGVSPRLLTLRRIPPGAVIGLAVLGVALFAAFGVWVMTGVSGAVLAAALGWWWWLPRNVSAWRYAERDDDLLVSRGRLLRRLTIVPYGRMQVIDVEAGPLESRLGIASVELVTASASTNAKIPGLPLEVAQDLRNRLTAKGEATAAGL
ncbi:MAG TPA: PH domain-containing protein [Nocardioidaceae bacterium]|nr:PH domain-containing protein [Nocardioidaceae bacterium]